MRAPSLCTPMRTLPHSVACFCLASTNQGLKGERLTLGDPCRVSLDSHTTERGNTYYLDMVLTKVLMPRRSENEAKSFDEVLKEEG